MGPLSFCGWWNLLKSNASNACNSCIKGLLGTVVGVTGLLDLGFNVSVEKLEELGRDTTSRFLDQLTYH